MNKANFYQNDGKMWIDLMILEIVVLSLIFKYHVDFVHEI